MRYLKFNYISKTMTKELKYLDKSIEMNSKSATNEYLTNGEYQFLKKSQKINGWLWGSMFDLRFNQIKDSLIAKSGIIALFSFLKYKSQFASANPHIKSEPRQQDKEQLQRQLKMYKPDFSITNQHDIKYTWIGHSTAVIQIGSDCFMIDPVFSERSSRYQFIGPKRYRPPACQIKQLPKIDVVLVSHDHYDHLDQNSLNEIQQKFKPIFVAGLESQDVFPANSDIRVMDWMDEITIHINNREYKITFVPVCHWSRRWIFDYNFRLWGGFVIETPFNQKIFYSGDTGYCGVFKQIGDKFGPFDLSILPIGAYEPNEALRPQHINPDQAVLIHKELRSRKSIGVHWGTFPLGKEGYFQAKYDLANARVNHNLKDQQFLVICHGQSIVISKQNSDREKTQNL